MRLFFARVPSPVAVLAWLGMGVAGLRGDVTLPALISDNMVLQQKEGIHLWGKADPGESVRVKLGGQTVLAKLEKDGRWTAALEGMKAGGPYEMTISGKNSVTIHNIAVGEVWLGAGESNMEMKVAACRNAVEEMATATYPMLRIFTVKHQSAEQPAAECEGAWQECTPETVKGLSAVSYYFGRQLNRDLRTPVGVICSAWGGSPIQAWMPEAVLTKKKGGFPEVLEQYESARSSYPAAEAAYEQSLAHWKAAAKEAKGAGGPVPSVPVPPLNPDGPRRPAGLYNGMVAPLLPYGVRGVIWYQGETNTGEPARYARLFPAMIDGWRAAWQRDDLPFLYVQLPNFLPHHDEPRESQWAELREAQAAALSLPKTGMAVTIDIGDEVSLHPEDKQDVGTRLAGLAERQVYGRANAAGASPMYASMKVDGSRVALTFAPAGAGLVDRNGPPLKGFAVAGADGRFAWASATIKGDRVIVQSKEVPRPVAVRYAWGDSPDCDLAGKGGLPAAPFRTDSPKQPAR